MRHATYTPLGHRVRGALAVAGLRQVDVAEELGISQSELSRRITGRRRWRDGELAKIAKICGVPERSLTAKAREAA